MVAIDLRTVSACRRRSPPPQGGVPSSSLGDEGVERVWQRYVARRLVLGHVRAVFVFDSEQHPHASPVDLGEGHEEGDNCAVLSVLGEDGIEDPGEAQQEVRHHDDVIQPCTLEG